MYNSIYLQVFLWIKLICNANFSKIIFYVDYFQLPHPCNSHVNQLTVQVHHAFPRSKTLTSYIRIPDFQIFSFELSWWKTILKSDYSDAQNLHSVLFIFLYCHVFQQHIHLNSYIDTGIRRFGMSENSPSMSHFVKVNHYICMFTSFVLKKLTIPYSKVYKFMVSALFLVSFVGSKEGCKKDGIIQW